MEKLLSTARLYFPLARPYAPHAAALLFFAFLGWANGYFQSTKPVDNPLLKDTWALPNWSPFRAGEEKTRLATLDIWDGQKSRAVGAAKPVAQSATAWRLVGTVRNGKTYAAVIQLDADGRIRRVMAGDALPNGEKVVGVREGSLQIDNNGNAQEIKLFQSSDQQEKK